MIVLEKSRVIAATSRMLEAVGLDLNAVELDQFAVMKHQATAFVLALRKHYDREQVYHGLWRTTDDPFGDIRHHIEHKAARLRQHLHNMAGPFTDGDGGPGESEKAHEEQIVSAAMDDALDLINYAAFFAQLLHEYAERYNLELTS